MVNKSSKKETKRMPKGQRIHQRRLKQAAGKEANITSSQSSPSQPVRLIKQKDQS
ncbi:MAG: hypothetical protein ACM3PY_15635 [Omnitrophica WOR_2 bacterium]